jgi:hypothetical protein
MQEVWPVKKREKRLTEQVRTDRTKASDRREEF